jgi:hypothetical protein
MSKSIRASVSKHLLPSLASASLMLVVVLPAVGCAEKATQKPPSLSGPAGAIDPVKPSMWALSQEVSVLRELTERSTPPDDQARAEMTRRLTRVDEILGALAALPAENKHPLLSTELGTFQDDVKAARAALDREPVDIAKIRVVTDGCKRCHVVAAREVTTETRLARD